MSKVVAQVNTVDTFQVWLDRTNLLARNFADTVTMNGDDNIGDILLTGDLTLLSSDGITSSVLTADVITSQLDPKKILFRDSGIEVERDIEIYNQITETPEERQNRSIKFYQETVLEGNVLEWQISVGDYTAGEEVITNGAFTITGGNNEDCKLIIERREDLNEASIVTGTNLLISYDILPFSSDTYLTPDQGDTNYVNVSGDTMTGNLTVGGGQNGIALSAADGSVTATGEITAFGSLSDINVKENIEKIEGALDKIDQISGYLFNYKGDDRRMTGVIAQEVEEVLPEVVYETVDNKGNDVKSVRYGNMMGLVIESIKELRQEIENLKS